MAQGCWVSDFTPRNKRCFVHSLLILLYPKSEDANLVKGQSGEPRLQRLDMCIKHAVRARGVHVGLVLTTGFQSSSSGLVPTPRMFIHWTRVCGEPAGCRNRRWEGSCQQDGQGLCSGAALAELERDRRQERDK